MRSRLALVLVGVALALPALASGRARPTLSIVDGSPLTLRGAHFQPHEVVRVTVVMGERTLRRQLRAGRLGGFTVRFVGVRLNYCALPLLIKVRGASSGLVQPRMPIVDCAMP